MSDYTAQQHQAAVSALMRMRQKFINVRGLGKEAPDWITKDETGRLVIEYTEGLMDELISEVDRMIVERDYE